MGPDHTVGNDRGQFNGLGHRSTAQSWPGQQPKPNPVVVKTSGTRPVGTTKEGCGSRGTGDNIGICSGGSVRCGGPEVDSLRVALKQAKEVRKGLLARVFVQSRAYLTELDAKRAVVNATFKEPAQRLDALKQQFASATSLFDTESELRQMRETAAQLK